MQIGDQVYVKGPRGSFAGQLAGEIGEVMYVNKGVYPDSPRDERDLFLVAFPEEIITRNSFAADLCGQTKTLHRLERRPEGHWPGDQRICVLMSLKELEPYQDDSPVVG